jgi:3-phosphoglycerate kinase
MKLKTPLVKDIANKTVLVRVDYNVPLVEKAGQLVVKDDRRVRASLETLKFLCEHGAKVICISHLGRPTSAREAKLSLKPVADHLREISDLSVTFVSDCVGPDVAAAVDSMAPGTVLVLENLRYYPGEKENNKHFAKQLAAPAQVFVNDAFSACHRAHASTEGVTHFLPSFAGCGLEAEIKGLTKVIEKPARPFVVIIGGAKISDKVEAVVNLAHLADVVLLGGGVANNFLKAEGLEIHKSYLQDAPADLKKKGINYVNVAAGLLAEAKLEKIWLDGHIPLPKILYPLDVVAARSPESEKTEVIDLTSDAADTPRDKALMYLDIGPKTIQLYEDIICAAKTVFWNGPLGYSEKTPFAAGTRKIAQAITQSDATSIVGGGDTVNAVDHLGLEAKFDYISTAGGAALEFLAGKKLPGLEPLMTR